jgi:glycosyltransferase involved in cell wall biosynthesis
MRRLGTRRIATRLVGSTGVPWCRRLFARLDAGLADEAAPGYPRDAYQRADLLVLPTMHDGFGVVVAEAMASGLPVITTDRCGAAEWIRPGDTGWIVPAGDTDALAAAMDAAIHARSRLRDMGMAARRDIEALAGAGDALRAFISAELMTQPTSDAVRVRGTDRLLAEAAVRS